MRNIVLSLLLAFTLPLAACTTRQPRIILETDQILFGDVTNGEVVSREITVRNDGYAPLVVDAISTSCGCTQARLDPMIISPGGNATLHVEFDSGAHGSELTGPMLRQVFIASNDPQQPEVVVELTANIVAQMTP